MKVENFLNRSDSKFELDQDSSLESAQSLGSINLLPQALTLKYQFETLIQHFNQL